MHRIDKTPCELLHNAFCKRILGVYKSTSNIISKAEIGRLPLSFYIILQVIKYWNHILEKPIDSLLHQSYLSELNNSSEWTSFVKTILTLCDLQNKWDNQTILNNNEMSILKSNLRKMFLKLYCDAKKPDHLKFSFNLQLQTRSNLLMPAEYTKMNIPLIYRKGLTRIRLQSNRLGIVTGRFSRPVTPLQNRICPTCKVLDDENHLFWNCSLTEQIRVDFQNHFTTRFANFINLDADTKTNLLLNPLNENDAILCGKFINKIGCKRNLF